MDKKRVDELTYAGLWLILTEALFAYHFFIARFDGITYDSSYQYFLNLHSWKEIFTLIPQDYSPPLYPIMLKAFSSIFGTELPVLRSFSILFLSLLLMFALFPLRRLMGNECALLSVVLFFTSAYNLNFICEIRPTVPAYVFSTGMIIYFMLAFFHDLKKDYIAFTVLALLCMYTHNVSLIFTFCVYLVALTSCVIKKRKDALIRFLISGISVAVLYIPWLIILIKQFGNASEHFWEEKQSLLYALSIVFIDYVDNINYSMLSIPVIILLVFLPLINVILLISKDKYKKARRISDLITPDQIRNGLANFDKGLFLLITILVSVIFFYLLTVVIIPIFAVRYFYIFSGAGIIFVSCLATQSKGRRWIPGLLAVLMVITFGFNLFTTRASLISCDEDRIYTDMEELSGDTPVFIHFHEHSVGIMSYTFPWGRHFVSPDTFTVLKTWDVFGVDLTELQDTDDIWNYTDEVYVFNYDYWDPVEKYPDYFDTNVIIEPVGYYRMPYWKEVNFNYSEATIYRIRRAD